MRTPSPRKWRVRPPVDHWVDRPEMEAPQGVELTGTNRPSDLNTTHETRVKKQHAASTVRFPNNKHREPTHSSTTAQQNSSATEADTRLAQPPPALFKAAGEGCGGRVFGGHGGGETPGPIPNPEVKPSSADGTARETVWESRTPPDNNPREALPHQAGPLFIYG